MLSVVQVDPPSVVVRARPEPESPLAVATTVQVVAEVHATSFAEATCDEEMDPVIVHVAPASLVEMNLSGPAIAMQFETVGQATEDIVSTPLGGVSVVHVDPASVVATMAPFGVGELTFVSPTAVHSVTDGQAMEAMYARFGRCGLGRPVRPPVGGTDDHGTS